MTTLPIGWHESTLAEVASLGSGGTPQAKNSAYYGGDIPWAVIGDLNDGVVRSTAQSITPAGLENSSAKMVPAGTILLGMYGSIGKMGIAGMPMATNQAIATIRAGGQVDHRYLFYFLLAQRRELDGQGKGAAQRNISQTVLKPWPVRFPTALDEQRRIVDLLEDHLSRLDAADGYLHAMRQRLTAMERSELDRLFSGTEIPLAELIEGISAGKSFGRANAPAGDDEWGVIKVSAMTWGQFDPTENKAVPADRVDQRFEIREGDLLVSRANTDEYVGASVLVGPVRSKLVLSDKSLRVTSRPGVRVDWLWRALQAPSARRQISAMATGTKESMRNISQDSLKRVLLPRANPDAQAAAVEAFAESTAAMSRLRTALSASQVRSRALHRSLLAAAFSGGLTDVGTALPRAEELANA